MKKIINGKLYNTETAKNMGVYWNGNNPNDFSFYSETLYRKVGGEFFLYGEGGASSKYSVVSGMNEWSGSAKIIPLDYEAAKKWAEDHLAADDYEDIFGKIAEDDSKRQICLSISKTAYETIKRNAVKSGMNFSEYIENIVKEA